MINVAGRLSVSRHFFAHLTGKRVLLFGGICTLMLLGLKYTVLTTEANTIPPFSLIDNGDVIFRGGGEPVSDLSRMFSRQDKRFSHVGILIKQDKDYQVIHSIADGKYGYDGVVIESLEAFLRDANDWAVYRLKEDNSNRDKVAEASKNLLQLDLPFDKQFDLDDHRALYCTELVMLAANTALGEKIFWAKSKILGKQYLSIEDIQLSKFLTLVSEYAEK